MMDLDVPTLFFLFAISNAFIGVLLLIFNYGNKNQKEVTTIYLSSKFIQTIFWVCFAHRYEWNIYVTYVLANTLSLLSTYLEFYCFYFLDRKVNYKILITHIAIILLASTSLFYFIHSEPSVKVLHMAVLLIAIYWTGGITLILNHRGFNTLKIVGAMGLLTGIILVSKFFIPSNSSALLSPNFVIVLNYIISYLLGFSWTIFYLSVLNQIAQKEILLRNLAIEDDNVKLKQLNLTKDKLFSIIAHDLKNPISAIIQLSQMLSGKHGKLTEAEQEEVTRSILKSANTTSNLLSNLLQWGRSESGTLSMQQERISLQQIVKDCEQILSETITQKEIIFINEIPADVHVFADYNMISTVFRNLIANAVKFTKEGGTVNVNSNMIDGKAIIKVSDTGVGIPEDILNQLLDVHFQYYTKGTNNESGTGLGLKLCKEFVERNGGTIGAESIVDKGSTFYFTLKLAD